MSIQVDYHHDPAADPALRAFADAPNRVLNRDQLLDMAHNRNTDPFDRSIDTHISRIRAAIEDDPRHPQRVITVRGTGYRLSAS